MNIKRVLILSGLSLAAMLGGFLLLAPTGETAPPEVGTYPQAVPLDVQYMEMGSEEHQAYQGGLANGERD